MPGTGTTGILSEVRKNEEAQLYAKREIEGKSSRRSRKWDYKSVRFMHSLHKAASSAHFDCFRLPYFASGNHISLRTDSPEAHNVTEKDWWKDWYKMRRLSITECIFWRICIVCHVERQAIQYSACSTGKCRAQTTFNSKSTRSQPKPNNPLAEQSPTWPPCKVSIGNVLRKVLVAKYVCLATGVLTSLSESKSIAGWYWSSHRGQDWPSDDTVLGH